MAATFRLEIMTPEKSFLNVEAEAVTVTTPDGELEVLAHHAPIVCTLDIGEMRVKVNGEWRAAFHSGGFLETRADSTVVFAQACEWAEDIDVRRAQASLDRIRERMRGTTDVQDIRHSQVSMARAMTRLKITKQKYNQ